MIKKASFNIFLGVVACSQACICFVNSKTPLKQTIKNNALHDGQLKCEINDFGPPKHDPNLPVGKQTIYDFNLDIYMTGGYYEYGAKTLNVIGHDPTRKVKKNFFNKFLGGQREIYPYLFTWSKFIADLRNQLKAKAKEVVDMSSMTAKYFLSQLSVAFLRKLLFFNWFEDIFLVQNIEPYYHPIYPLDVYNRNHFVSEMRENGAIFRIPFVSKFFYASTHRPYVVGNIGANMQMFPQDKTLINQTLLLSYFYTAPWQAYSINLFNEIGPTIKIKLDPENPLIIDNQNSIFKALRAIMHIARPLEKLSSYLALDPITSQQKITNKPVLFTVFFLRVGTPHQTIYANQQFSVLGTTYNS